MKGLVVGTVLAGFVLAGCTSQQQNASASPQYYAMQKEKEMERREYYRNRVQQLKNRAEAESSAEADDDYPAYAPVDDGAPVQVSAIAPEAEPEPAPEYTPPVTHDAAVSDTPPPSLAGPSAADTYAYYGAGSNADERPEPEPAPEYAPLSASTSAYNDSSSDDSEADSRTEDTSLSSTAVDAEDDAAIEQQSADIDPVEDGLPSDVRPDQCYARITVPARYDVKEKQVLVSPEHEEITAVPAEYETVTKRVLVHEAYDKLVAVPATYKEVKGKVKVKDATSKLITIPAEYKTVTKRVLVQPEHKAWLPGHGNIEKYDESTGKIVHLATVPAKYENVETKELVAAERTETKEIPAEYKEMTRKVVDVPAHTKTITVPAVYRNIQVVEQVKPPTELKKTVPAVYDSVTTRKKVQNERLAWREVVCDNKLTEDMVRKLQQALNANGFSVGEADGVMGNRTRNALSQYQEEKGIAMGRITLETLQHLGIR